MLFADNNKSIQNSLSFLCWNQLLVEFYSTLPSLQSLCLPSWLHTPSEHATSDPLELGSLQFSQLSQVSMSDKYPQSLFWLPLRSGRSVPPPPPVLQPSTTPALLPRQLSCDTNDVFEFSSPKIIHLSSHDFLWLDALAVAELLSHWKNNSGLLTFIVESQY